MKNKWMSVSVIWLVITLLLISCGAASAANIDPYDESSQWAWGENIGWLSFDPLLGPGVTVTDSELYGYVWAENIGWINLNCENRDTCDEVDYRVTNDGSGILGGFAWGENVGWISFSCENNDVCDNATYGVTIGPAGYFSGYAWGENIGWINFDLLSQPAFQVQTSWEEYVPSRGGGGGSDLPPNRKPVIDKVEAEQLDGYTVMFSVEAHDPDGEIVRYFWQFTDASSSNTPNSDISHTFDDPGIYEVMATVRDNNGGRTSETLKIEVVENDSNEDDLPPPAPEEKPECVEDSDCDDDKFCNGEETCIGGECAEGDVPCTVDEICIEDEQACWTEEIVEGKSLNNTFRSPGLLSQRCVWLVLQAEGTEIFNPEECLISFTGPGGTEQGVTYNNNRSIQEFAGYILAPVCIECEVEPGEWMLQLMTESGTARETIESIFTIE